MAKPAAYIYSYKDFVFLLLLLSLYFILDFQQVIIRQPFGIHFIRQTDCLAFVRGYQLNGFDFFYPRVLNLASAEGKAASEFPLLYYITALSSRLYNKPEFILRLITLFIGSAGYYFLYRLITRFIENFLQSMALTFLVISSTVLLYYTNNFLPDVSALGFTLIGWYFFYSYLNNQSNHKSIVFAFLFFTLSALLKVTFFVNAIAALLTALILFNQQKQSIFKAILDKKQFIFIFLISALVVFLWNGYVIYYNTVNQSFIFLVEPRPLWKLSPIDRKIVWDYITRYWYSKYYYQTTIHIFTGFAIVGILLFRRANRALMITAVFLASGCFCYCLLFFAQFKDHDYYFITIIPGVIFIVLNGFVGLKNSFPKIVSHFIVTLLLITLSCLSINYARQKLNDRYSDSTDTYAAIGQKLQGADKWLDQLYVNSEARVIILGDSTPNGGLYFINRQGWSIGNSSNNLQQLLNYYINNGADYLLATDSTQVKNVNGIVVGQQNGLVLLQLKK